MRPASLMSFRETFISITNAVLGHQRIRGLDRLVAISTRASPVHFAGVGSQTALDYGRHEANVTLP